MGTFNPKAYWQERLQSNYGPVGVGDNRFGTRYNEWLYRVRKVVFLRKMGAMRIDFSKAEILDIGPGTGFYVDRWTELQVKHITGADITSVVVERLSQKYPDAEFLQMDIGGDIATLGNRHFDIVSAFDVLFHIVDDERFAQAIKNIYSLVKPGGYFVFSDNFLHGDTVRGRDQASRSLGEIELLVKAAGFEIVERSPMFVVMAYPVDSSSRLWQKLWLVAIRLSTITEISGYLVGMLLYPIELICLSVFRESPTTEMMICRKPAGMLSTTL
jgi:SAM-dependent methyltransferase